MAKQSAKEKCFQEALDHYQKKTGKDLKLDHQLPWAQREDTGVWEIAKKGFLHAVFSTRKTNKHLATGKGRPGTYKQPRVPDVTVNKTTVVDTKFTRSDGTVDTWGTKKGLGNGNLQKDDYADINKQSNPNGDAISLDPESCKCNGDPPQENVYIEVPGLTAPFPHRGGTKVPGFRLPPIRVPIYIP